MMSAEQYIQNLLGLPQHIKVEFMVSVGYPNEIKNQIANSELEDNKVKHNHYAKTYVPKRGA
jgi:hypothetical protein